VHVIVSHEKLGNRPYYVFCFCIIKQVSFPSRNGVLKRCVTEGDQGSLSVEGIIGESNHQGAIKTGHFSIFRCR